MALLVGNVLRHAARHAPDRLAATLGDEELTFAELEDRANRVAHTLTAQGVRYGDRVAWWGDTSLEALPVFFGLAKLGAVFAPVNARLGPAEAAEVAGYARPRLLVVDDERAEGARELDLPMLSHTELAHAAGGASADDIDAPDLEERDPHVIFFTSGSTGRPKGVVLSHRANMLRTHPQLAAETEGGLVCMFPLFHMAGWTLALGCWQTRRPIHFVRVPDADSLVSTVARRQATRIYLIPAVWARVLERGVGDELAGLREADTGTSATPPELVAAIRDALPHTVTRIFYGSTEAGAGTVLAHVDVLRKPGSVGLPQAGVDVRLTDEGEVCVHSELLMDGYFEQLDETAAALRDGWYHTGDVGALDDEGYLSIIGRARDVIRTGGETVAPSEVEAVLADHPAVSEVAVVGVPDPQWGEVVCAVVVATPGASVDVEGLRAHCDGRLAGFKHPRRLALADELPRTPATGQIQRTLLVERLLAE
ncbi:MAG: class I adenylate-forming enzyme family protein [Actinomycetota bacterium]